MSGSSRVRRAGSSRRPATALIGAGKLARALAAPLAEAGYPVVSVASRTVASARRLCRRLPGARPTTDPERAAGAARLVLLAVPDREIAALARILAGGRDPALRSRTVIHHAGAMGLEPLRPLALAGAAVAVLHPLQCLGPAPVLRGSRARIEGDRRGARVARRLARDLGLVPLALAERPKAADRELYHAAASLASNDLLALLQLASRLLERLGLDRAEAVAALLPLMRGTLAQVERAGTTSALTGPIARGDQATVAAHLRRLGRASRDGAEVHRLLSRQLVALASEGGGLTPAQRASLRRLLR